jgi:hypothetical protein
MSNYSKTAIYSEHNEAVTFMEEMVLRYPEEAALLFHIPNEGRRNPWTGKYLKQEGMKSGVPDYFLPVASGSYHGLFIELKRRFKAVLTPTQIEWLDALKEQGYAAHVAYGSEAAIKIVKDYLNERKSNVESA